MAALGGAPRALLAALARALPMLFTRQARVRLLLRGGRRTRICDMRDGQLVKVVGQVRASEPPMRSAIQGEECVYQQVEVVEIRGEGEEESTVLLAATELRHDFLIHDDTGDVLVAASGASMLVVAEWRSGYEPAVEQFVQRNARGGVGWRGLRWDTRIRYREALLRPGTPVAALGVARVASPGGGGPYRGSPRAPTLDAGSSEEVVVSALFEDVIDDLLPA